MLKILPLAILCALSPRFLDLPDGFGTSEEEEDEPELIEFYNDEYEGDAFFFCLDKSDSMSGASSSGTAKYLVRNRETIKALTGLTRRSTATVVFFDHKKLNSDCYGDPPIVMDAAGKGRLIGRVAATTVANHDGADSCICEGMQRLFQVVVKSTKEHKLIILVADGRAQCDGGEQDPERLYAALMALNVTRVPINTIYTGVQSGDDWTYGKPLLERLARSTGGKFKIAQ